MRALAAGLALVVLAGCGGDDSGRATAADDTVAVTTTTAPNDDIAVRLAQLLLRPRELEAHGFTPVVVNRPFTAQRSTRILLCDEDLRSELRVIAGRQSRFAAEAVELSHTVTSGGDTTAFLGRFDALIDRCEGPWTEPALPTGGGPVTREITGRYPLPETDVPGAGAVIRSRNREGGTDTIVIVLAQGPVVSSLSISGPVGSDFDVVDSAVIDAAAKLSGLQSAGAP